MEKFDAFCNPRKSIIHERYVFSLRNQENDESIDQNVAVLKSLVWYLWIRELKESLIRDRLVFGIVYNSVMERLLRDPEWSRQTAIEKFRSAELTNAQLKDIKVDQTTVEEAVHNVKSNGDNFPIKRKQNLLTTTLIVSCKYCGQKHPKD